MVEIVKLVDCEIFKKCRYINVFKVIFKFVVVIINKVLWWDIMLVDEIECEFYD